MTTCTYLTGGCGIINPVPTALTIVCFMNHTAVLVIQNGQTALDRARRGRDETDDDDYDELSKYDRLIHYLESVGK